MSVCVKYSGYDWSEAKWWMALLTSSVERDTQEEGRCQLLKNEKNPGKPEVRVKTITDRLVFTSTVILCFTGAPKFCKSFWIVLSLIFTDIRTYLSFSSSLLILLVGFIFHDRTDSIFKKSIFFTLTSLIVLAVYILLFSTLVHLNMIILFARRPAFLHKRHSF